MKNGTAALWIFGLLMFPGTALAGNWGEAWGTLAWGAALPLPGLGLLGGMVLAMGLAATAAWTLRKRRPALGLTVVLVLVAIPLVVVAGTLAVPNTFTNGTVADADEVNANFDEIETEVNDNDSRITAAQSTADAVTTDAAAAQSTADGAVTDAATAQGTANAAVTNAAAAQTTANTAVTDAAAAQGTANTAVADAATAQSTADASQAILSSEGPHVRPGSNNTAVGENALLNNTASGKFNTAFGQDALRVNTIGSRNTALGEDALDSNIDGYANTAVGQDALQGNTSGGYNTAVGQAALVFNTEGEKNTSVGNDALRRNISGDNNTAVGEDALRNNTTGASNTALGNRSGFYTTGSNNILIGNEGVGGESNTIRFGTAGTHTVTHLTGDVQIDGSSIATQIAALQAQIAELQAVVLLGSRFFPCADGLTVADYATSLLWERKTGTVDFSLVICESIPGGCPDPHDVNNRYKWSITGGAADGNAFTDFLANLNADSFAGHTDWRLPSISELQSILIGPGVTHVANAQPSDPASGTNATGQATTCGAPPCVDPGFAVVGGPVYQNPGYWSASAYTPSPDFAYTAYFNTGYVTPIFEPNDLFVRAVRTGSCSY